MTVGQLMNAAFGLAFEKFPSINDKWRKISYSKNFIITDSLSLMSIQQLGYLDLLIRSMEDENATYIKTSMPSIFFQTYLELFSKLWVASAYEIVRSLKERKNNLPEEFNELHRLLELLRIPLVKHQLAQDRSIKEPLLFRKISSNNNEKNDMIYDKKDRNRTYTAGCKVSKENGSISWVVYDLIKQVEIEIERRNLSEKFLALADINA